MNFDSLFRLAYGAKSFSGRMARKPFFKYYLMLAVYLWIVEAVFATILGSNVGEFGEIVKVCLTAPAMVMQLALVSRRLHDAGRSNISMWVSLVALAALVFLPTPEVWEEFSAQMAIYLAVGVIGFSSLLYVLYVCLFKGSVRS